jgi:hypothetical protein
MSSSRSLGVALLSLLAGAGCTQVVDVDEYTFVSDPCGDPPPSCTGGRDLTLVVVVADTPHEDEAGRRDGFDVDGTSDAICGQRDFVSPTGETGIDNQLAVVLDLYASLEGIDLREQNRSTYVRGEYLTTLFIGGYDGPDDDCVQVSYRAARLPEGVAPSTLDADGDGEIDPGLTFDYGPPLLRDTSACVIDGVVHASFEPALATIPVIATEARVERGRLRATLGETRTSFLLGITLRLEDLTTALPAEVLEFLRPRADVAPSTRGSRDCSAISFAFESEAVPAVRGSMF